MVRRSFGIAEAAFYKPDALHVVQSTVSKHSESYAVMLWFPNTQNINICHHTWILYMLLRIIMICMFDYYVEPPLNCILSTSVNEERTCLLRGCSVIKYLHQWSSATLLDGCDVHAGSIIQPRFLDSRRVGTFQFRCIFIKQLQTVSSSK